MDPLPIPGTTPGPDWANMLNAAIGQLQGFAPSVLLEAGVSTPPAGTPVGSIVYRKALPSTTWNFKNLSALPSGWTRRGIASETFDAAGMSASLAAGQGWQVAVPTTSTDYVVEAKLVTFTSSGVMMGPMLCDSTGLGGAGVWYNSPVGLLTAKVSGWQYGSTFINNNGNVGTTTYIRIRYSSAGNSFYASYSSDGVSWSTEGTALAGVAVPTVVSLGSLLGTGTMKVEYAKFTPGMSSGKPQGWWDGSTIQALW